MLPTVGYLTSNILKYVITYLKERQINKSVIVSQVCKKVLFFNSLHFASPKNICNQNVVAVFSFPRVVIIIINQIFSLNLDS